MDVDPAVSAENCGYSLNVTEVDMVRMIGNSFKKPSLHAPPLYSVAPSE